MSYRRKRSDGRNQAMQTFWDKLDGTPSTVTHRRIEYRPFKPAPAKPKVYPPRKITKAREEGSLEKDEDV